LIDILNNKSACAIDRVLMSDFGYIGEFVYEYRQRNALSLAALAEKASLSKSMLSQIENSKVNPTLPILDKLANAMEMSLADLIDPTSKPQKYRKQFIGDVKPTFSSDRSFLCFQLNKRSKYGCVRIDAFRFEKKGRRDSSGHGPRTVEYIYVEKGELHLEIGTQSFSISEGEIFEFQAGVPHSYVQSNGTLSSGLILMYYL